LRGRTGATRRRSARAPRSPGRRERTFGLRVEHLTFPGLRLVIGRIVVGGIVVGLIVVGVICVGAVVIGRLVIVGVVVTGVRLAESGDRVLLIERGGGSGGGPGHHARRDHGPRGSRHVSGVLLVVGRRIPVAIISLSGMRRIPLRAI